MDGIALPFNEGDVVVFKPILGDECYEREVPEYGTVGVVKQCVLNIPMLSWGWVAYLVTVDFPGLVSTVNDEDLKLYEGQG